MGILFDGVDDYLLGTDINAWDSATALSISGWVYCTSDAAGIVISKSYGLQYGLRLYRLNTNDNATITLQKNIGDAKTITSVNNAWPINNWLHIGVTYEANVALRLYINGIEDANSPIDPTGYTLNALTRPILIGCRDNVSPNLSTFFPGFITNVGVWLSVLTATDMLLLAGSKLHGMVSQIQPDSLLLNLPLDDGVHGASADGATIRELVSGSSFTGIDGANNTGLTWQGETLLSYPSKPIYCIDDEIIAGGLLQHRGLTGNMQLMHGRLNA